MRECPARRRSKKGRWQVQVAGQAGSPSDTAAASGFLVAAEALTPRGTMFPALAGH